MKVIVIIICFQAAFNGKNSYESGNDGTGQLPAIEACTVGLDGDNENDFRKLASYQPIPRLAANGGI